MLSQVGVPEILILLAIFAVGGIFWLVVLIDVVRTPDSIWAAADQSKVVSVLLMLFLGLIGTFIYFVAARPALKGVTFRGAVNGEPDTGA